MGSRSVKFSFTPGENEQIETVIKIPEERRSIIHGIVKDCHNKIVRDAIVKLYEVSLHDEHHLKPLTHVFTDECGQFAFGPLWAGKHYVIKVWINNVKIRELIIRPDEDDCTYHKKFCKKPSKPCEKHDEYEEDSNIHGQYMQHDFDDDDMDD
ncbi:MAG TPA: carboxypeptidase regulatory-like domain-containing protein [Clostridia bacterium]